jgi:hypothetical protein
MKTMIFQLALGSVVLLGTSRAVGADVYQGSPREAVVLPDDGSGVTKIAFLFDFSSLREGGNRHIEEALLDWRVSDLAVEDLPTFFAYPITTSWTRSALEAGAAPSMSKESVSDWQMNALAPETNDGRLVRLDLTEMVGQWAAGTTTNYGIIVATSGLSANALGAQLGKVQLTIRYGFRDN